MPNDRIVILGAGRIGATLADLIRSGPTHVTIEQWDVNPRLVLNQSPLSETIPGALAVFCCTPSWTFRQLLTDIGPLLQPVTSLVSLAKGCEEATGKTMYEVATELVSPQQPIAIVGGPMMAEVLRRGHRGVAVVGSTFHEPVGVLTTLFERTPLAIEPSTDPNGVCLAGVTKNIYAFAVGVGDGIGWPADIKRRFFLAAKEEMIRCGVAAGAQEVTMRGAAGLGDFLETATSPSSHNRGSGEQLGRDGKLARPCESSVSLPSILQRVGNKPLPILRVVTEILTAGKPTAALTAFANALQP